TLVVFRIEEMTQLCDSFSMEKLYKAHAGATDNHTPQTPGFGVLEIHTRIWNFLDEISERLADGIKCNIYFDLKIREFFFLLKAYYTTQEVAGFFYLILSDDTAFSEYVRLHRHKFRNVEEMANSMHMTPRQFGTRFKKAFNQTPYKWMKEARAKLIRKQLINTHKPVKLIALENGFSDMAHFTKFCKKELGKTPTQLKEDISLSEEGIDNRNDIFDKG
ncbi:helix-turn-helix transcriptional regulator, partial [Bacteroides sp. 51]|uniref:helix-turn-helix transcriptional regulator n=1 Tax=Bacteroides sp. 51 TaxID=2302938 RepID=UPI0013D49BC1